MSIPWDWFLVVLAEGLAFERENRRQVKAVVASGI